MKKTIAVLLVTVLISGLCGGCVTPPSGGAPQKAQSEVSAIEVAKPQNASVSLPAATDSVDRNMDKVTQAYIEGRYLDAIRMYEDALRDPSITITEGMKEAYYASFDKYVEAVCAKAETVYGANKDFDAAIQVLRGAVEAAYSYDSITVPLETETSRYLVLKYENMMDKAFMAGDYLNVARVYENATEKGIQVTEHMAQQYTACFKKYIEAACAEAEKLYNSNKDYDAAIKTLYRYMEDAEDFYGIYNELEGKMYDYIAAKYSYLIDKAYQEGNSLEVARKYQEADSYDVVIISKTMKQQYEDSVSKYMKTVSDEAQSAFGSNKDYNAAIKVVRRAIAEATDIPDILSKLQDMVSYYSGFEPFALTKLSPVQKAEFVRKGTDSFYPGGTWGNITPDLTRDVNNTHYNADTVFFSSRSGFYVPKDGDAYLVYNLNYEYCTLTGVVYRPYIALSCNHSWNIPGVVKIYGDDVLLWKSPDILMDTFDSFSFSLDVSGVRNLRIEINGLWDDGVIPKVCIGDLMLQK